MMHKYFLTVKFFCLIFLSAFTNASPDWLEGGRDTVEEYQRIVRDLKGRETHDQPYYLIHSEALARKVPTLFTAVEGHLQRMTAKESSEVAASPSPMAAEASSSIAAHRRNEEMDEETFNPQKVLKKFQKFRGKFEKYYMHDISLARWNLLMQQCAAGVTPHLHKSIVLKKEVRITAQLEHTFFSCDPHRIMARDSFDAYERGATVLMLMPKQPLLGINVLTRAFLENVGPVPVCFDEEEQHTVHAGIFRSIAEHVWHDSVHFEISSGEDNHTHKKLIERRASFFQAILKAAESSEDEGVRHRMMLALFMLIHESPSDVSDFPVNVDDKSEEEVFGDFRETLLQRIIENVPASLYDLQVYSLECLRKSFVQNNTLEDEVAERVSLTCIAEDERIAVYETRVRKLELSGYLRTISERGFVFKTEEQLQNNFRDHAWLFRACGIVPQERNLRLAPLTLRELRAALEGLLKEFKDFYENETEFGRKDKERRRLKNEAAAASSSVVSSSASSSGENVVS